jgi:hypothetical protein
MPGSVAAARIPRFDGMALPRISSPHYREKVDYGKSTNSASVICTALSKQPTVQATTQTHDGVCYAARAVR